MTNQIKPVPLHGGTLRVAFNGGENIRRSLPFNAVSVNVDNWSRYWYKLNPIEAYIPPFQNGVNIRLQFLNNFEFVCEAPPGIEQSVIVPTTAIPGNIEPVIAIFSSFDTNNDAGFSALEQSANISSTFENVTGVSPLTIATIDLTLYNGVYIFIHPQTSFNINFQFDTGNFSVLTLYNNQKVLITVPKMGQILTITITNPDPAPNISLDYLIRPFLGYADFNIKNLGATGANPPSLGIQKSIAGTNSVNINVNGMKNVMVTFKPRTGVGNAFNDIFLCRITMGNYANTAAAPIIFTRAFRFAEGTLPIVTPIFNILQAEANDLSIIVNVSNPASITDVAVHNVTDPADYYPLAPPMQYSVSGQTAVGVGVNVLLATLINGGLLKKLIFYNMIASATVGASYTVSIGSGIAPASVIHVFSALHFMPYIVELPIPISLTTSFSSIWISTTSATPLNVIWNFYTE